MSTTDQNFTLPTQGQADWDTDLNANFTIIARGYHKQLVAGTAINTGWIVSIGSDGFARPYDINSLASRPHAMAYKAIGSGDQDVFLLQGMVRSLDVLTPSVPGQNIFGHPTSAGLIATSFSGADRPIGIGVEEDGIFFKPGEALFPETVTDSAAISAIVGSTHLFVLDGGRSGFVRRLLTVGDSGDLVELQLWSNSSRTDNLYETKSGGISIVGSFIDQAGFPFFNTDASTLSGKVYGSIQVLSGAAVTSDTINVSVIFERFR